MDISHFDPELFKIWIRQDFKKCENAERSLKDFHDNDESLLNIFKFVPIYCILFNVDRRHHEWSSHALGWLCCSYLVIQKMLVFKKFQMSH